MKLLLWILVGLLPVVVIAQVVPGASPQLPIPAPTIIPIIFATPKPDPSLIPTMLSLMSLAKGWQSMGLYAALAAALKIMAELAKLSFLGNPWAKIPDKYKLLVSSFIGAALVLLGFVAAGAPILAALPAALGSAAGAGFLHEVVQDFFPGLSQPPSV